MAKKADITKDGVVMEGKLNEVIVTETIRPDGSRRIQQGFDFCPSLAEQHTAHLTNINYLMEKYKPDELAAYLAARSAYRTEVLGHDFSAEPDLQTAMNVVLRSRQEFEALDEGIRGHFRNHLEFLKFIDNPANAEKMIKLGLLKPKQVEILQGTEAVAAQAPGTTTTKEEK